MQTPDQVAIHSRADALAWGDAQAAYARSLEAQIMHLEIALALADACDKAGSLLLLAADAELERLREI